MIDWQGLREHIRRFGYLEMFSAALGKPLVITSSDGTAEHFKTVRPQAAVYTLEEVEILLRCNPVGTNDLRQIDLVRAMFNGKVVR